jgi:RNA 2',3'-cyclic 3'-phosphodiesterase
MQWRDFMRAFLGIDFSNDIKKSISSLQKELKGNAIKGRWKYYENFHVTLKFFDNINDIQKIDIDHAAKAVCENFGRFKLGFGDLGTFEGKGNIKVLWIGLTGDEDRLNKLHNNIDCSLSEYGFEKDKRNFKAHITIGQELLFNCTLEELNKIRTRVDFSKAVVNKLYLFKSEQIGTSRVYTKIEEYRL